MRKPFQRPDSRNSQKTHTAPSAQGSRSELIAPGNEIDSGTFFPRDYFVELAFSVRVYQLYAE